MRHHQVIFYLLFLATLSFAQTTKEQIHAIEELAQQRQSNRSWTSSCKHAIHTAEEVKTLLNIDELDIAQTLQLRDYLFFDTRTHYLINNEVISIIGYYLIKHHNHKLKNFITYDNLYTRAKETYFPIFEQHFADYSIPKALLLLPIAETDLKNHLISGDNAAGLWQFTEDTAKEYGLIFKHFDLRTDIHASTDAACRYLKDMYENYSFWPMTVLGYNGGHNRIQDLIDLHLEGPIDIKIQWQSFFDNLPTETQCHLNRLVALNYAFSYFDDIQTFRH
ncbi:MAG TPA: transglycosylase SLT domain-containing protein [Oligoflexia bacterium]|nr:transglycosylase SLT domain-containing protein [Oligoflexia bacterium]HMR24633.1 transglycosylase SLT domain-containing protein [Oligoflexia bacterium]